nr:hypothetical protein [Burkholderia gladioli]
MGEGSTRRDLARTTTQDDAPPREAGQFDLFGEPLPDAGQPSTGAPRARRAAAGAVPPTRHRARPTIPPPGLLPRLPGFP